MGNEPAGVIESGVKKGLHAAAIYPPDPGTEQHVGLPDLIAVFGFKLLVRRWCEQLFFRQTALFEETVECGSRERVRVLTGRQGQFAQQSRAGAMRVLTLETFDEAGQLRSDGAGLSAVLARLGCQCLETTVAVAQRPIEQRIDGNRRSFRMGDVVGAAAISWARRVSSPRGRRSITNCAISPKRNRANFSDLVSMRKTSRPRTIIRSGDLPLCKCYVGSLRERGTRRPAWFAARSE